MKKKLHFFIQPFFKKFVEDDAHVSHAPLGSWKISRSHPSKSP
jgi:hypothetical protein